MLNFVCLWVQSIKICLRGTKPLQLMNKSFKLYALYTGRSFMLEYNYTCAIVNVVGVPYIKSGIKDKGIYECQWFNIEKPWYFNS